MKKSVRQLLLALLVCLVCIGCKVEAQAAAKTQSLAVVTNKNGFRPSSGNFASIKVSVTSSGTSAKLRVRVVNSKGQYLFQKNYSNITKNTYYDIHWDGKAIQGNQAGLRAGQYPGTGNYRVEALTYYTTGNTKVYSKRTAVLPIKYTAPGGISGRSNLNYLPMLTGDKYVDYLAEVMCNAAGVKASMSQDEKVRRIYHWMTYNFKHVHYSLSGSYTKYYDLNSLTGKVGYYRNAINQKIIDGTVIFNFYKYSNISWNMERRIGQCNNHAAVFKILCNHVGIEAGVSKGYYLNRNGTRMGHYWNYAVVNGVTYYYDVDVEIQNLGKGQGDYYWYKKVRTEAEKTHLFTE